MTITGLRVPTDASTDSQSVEVYDITSLGPPITFTSLFYQNQVAGAGIINCNISVTAGQTIGIMGSRGSAMVNSYQTGPYTSSIGGIPVTLTRIYTNDSGALDVNQATNITAEPASEIGRVEMYYTVDSTDAALYYPFEEGTGSTTQNYGSYSAASGAIQGTASWTTPGQVGAAAFGSTTGNAGYVDTGYAPDLTTGDWSVAFWMNTTTGYGYPFADGGSNGFRCFVNNSNIYLYGGYSLTSASSVSDGTWHHVAYVWDSAASTVTLYVDGTQDAQATAQTPPSTACTGLQISYRNSNTTQFDGSVDDFGWWDRMLTTGEISSAAAGAPIGSVAAAYVSSLPFTENFDGANSVANIRSVTAIGSYPQAATAGLTSGTPFTSQAAARVRLMGDAVGSTATFTPVSAPGQVVIDFPNGAGSFYAVGAVDVSFDLSAYDVSTTQLNLSFSWASDGDDDQDTDGVFISLDGGVTWPVCLFRFPFNGAGIAYTMETIDVSAALAAQTLNYTSQVVIRFQCQDNYALGSGDGLLLDDISLSEPGASGGGGGGGDDGGCSTGGNGHYSWMVLLGLLSAFVVFTRVRGSKA
ncbi:MAG: LamG domain-containing protein [Planctomycetes bacterium]|nr:LamG domain-containing protein [Planctomycetota bacterium]MCA8947175.1 LamG domain-containing protein [Planctomycetota bacterium]